VRCLGHHQAAQKAEPQARRRGPRDLIEWRVIEAVSSDRDPVRPNSKLHEPIAHVPRRREKVGHVAADLAHVLEAPVRLILLFTRARRDCGQSLRRTAQLARGGRRQPAFDRAYRGGSEEAGCAHTTRRAHARVTLRRTAARAIVHVEELTAMTHQPVIVQRDEAGNATVGERSHDRRRETSQVMDVRHVRPKAVDQAARDGADDVVPICLLERARLAEGVVHSDDAKAVELLGADVVLGAARILLACQHQDLVAAELMERDGMGMGVDFAAALCSWGKPVDDDQDLHRLIRFAKRDSFRPLNWMTTQCRDIRASRELVSACFASPGGSHSRSIPLYNLVNGDWDFDSAGLGQAYLSPHISRHLPSACR
jgi:hypothetical protein